MRIHLAGLEKTGFTTAVGLSGQRYGLFSYYHMGRNPQNEQELVLERMRRYKLELICDSGLFTLMFGSGKGKAYDLPFMVEYTRRYLAQAVNYKLEALTIVECDVHKIIGMPAVHELRKYFRDSGLPVIYVWHREEGIDGLMKLCEWADYVAISVPELRQIFKQHDAKYQGGVIELLAKINEHTPGKKVHLLGNTIEYTMKTRQAYSCDSTSWLAGVRYGQGIVYHHQNLTKAHLRSPLFAHIRERAREEFPDAWAEFDTLTINPRFKNYLWNTFVSAVSYNRYQSYLDANYQWIGEQKCQRAE